MENSQQYAPFDVGREVAVSLSANNPSTESPSSTLMNSASPVGISLTHHFSESVGVGLPQQSPLFSSFLSSQPMFNGAYTSPTGFSNQNSFSAGFNSYADSSIWFSDAGAQLCVPTNQDLILTESDRKMLFSNSRIGNLEAVSMCSPLPADVYKTSINKDYLSYQSKSTSTSSGLADSQSWLCRSSIGYGTNQQNQQNVQQVGFKCNEQYSSCSILQTNLSDHNDQKHSSSNFENSCCVSSANNRSSNKDKEHQLKYSCCLLKGQNNLTQPCNHSPEQMRQAQDQGNFESLSTSYSSNSGIHEHMIYSQIPHIFNINNSPGQTGKKQISVRHVSPGQLPVMQQPFPEQTLSCEMLDNCYSNNAGKGVSKNNSLTNGSERSSCCRLNMPMNDDASSFSSHPFSHRQPLHSSVDCTNSSTATQLYSTNITTQYDCSLHVPKSHQFATDSLAAEHAPLNENNTKDNNQTDGSEAGDSDIVVEDSDEESESGVSIEEISKDLSLGRCCICNSMETSCSQLEYKFVQIKQNIPVTSSSQIPIFSKLTQVFCKDGNNTEFLNDSAVLCKICHSLIDSYDCLETKLGVVKQDLLQRYSRKEIPKSLNRTENILKEQTNQCTEKPTTGKTSQQTKPQLVTSTNEILEGIIAQENATVDKITDEKSPEKDAVWKPRFECKICSKSFISKRYMRKHQQHHTKSYSFCCDRCGKGFTVRRALENHLHLHSGEYQYQCDICGRQFIQRSSLKTHLLKHQGKFRVTCDQCGKGFMNDYALQIHLRVHTGDRPFICQYCGKSFGNKGNLLSHVKLCSGDKHFNCNQCDKGFSLKCQFRKHLLAEHGGKYEHSCSQCGKGFMKASDCKAHMATHTGLKPHKCQDCGKCYSSVGNLNQHYSAKHKENRDLKCTICEKTFLRKTAFTEHMDFHEGKRPHKCTQCEKTFISRRNLLAHLKWHAGDVKRLTCNICGKSIKHGLEVHMRSHSGYKPYMCVKCDASFTVKSSLDKHCRSIHADKNANS